MDFIAGLFNMDFTALVPNLNTMLGLIRFLLSLLLLAGPLALLILGFMYRFMAPPEANYKFGFRTYFGMGSVEAWRFSQRIAGIAFAALGLVLLEGPACGLENPGFELVLGPVTPCLEETEAGSPDLDTAAPGPVRCLCQRASALRGTWCQVFAGITQHSRPSGQTETTGACSKLGSHWRYSNKKAFSKKDGEFSVVSLL